MTATPLLPIDQARARFPLNSQGVIVRQARTTSDPKQPLVTTEVPTLVGHLGLDQVPAVVIGHTRDGHLVVAPARICASICLAQDEFRLD